jgi:hypothetical protein
MDSGDGAFLAFASFEHLRGLRDTDGRPLGEVKAPAPLVAAVPAELVACDYADARFECALPMNVSALLQINDHWHQILGTIRSIRAAFIGRTGRTPLTLLDLWRIAHAAVSTVSFRCLERGIAHAIPVADAALFKASAGIKYALRHAEVTRLGGRDAVGAYPSAASVWAYVEGERLLIGSAQVCAGPEMMIRDLLDVLVNGAGSAASGEVLDLGRLLVYADLLAVWETLALVQRAQERRPGGRLAGTCRSMLRDVCAATEITGVPEDVALGRQLIEDRLQRLFGRGSP